MDGLTDGRMDRVASRGASTEDLIIIILDFKFQLAKLQMQDVLYLWVQE